MWSCGLAWHGACGSLWLGCNLPEVSTIIWDAGRLKRCRAATEARSAAPRWQRGYPLRLRTLDC